VREVKSRRSPEGWSAAGAVAVASPETAQSAAAGAGGAGLTAHRSARPGSRHEESMGVSAPQNGVGEAEYTYER
jgi:hypothetical protein